MQLPFLPRYEIDAWVEMRPEGVVYQARDRQGGDRPVRLIVARDGESRRLLLQAHGLQERMAVPPLAFGELPDGACYQVLEGQEPGTSLRPFQAAFVGRRKELSALSAAAREACNTQRARSLRLVGAAGSGKTRLMDELAGRLRHDGFATLSVRGGEGLDGTPLGPWRSALRPLLSQVDGAALSELAPVLVTILPELSEHPAPALEPRSERARLMRSIASLLEYWAAKRPLLLCLDDWDRADEASRELADTMLRAFENLPLCLVTALQEPSEGTDEVMLGPLASKESRALYRGVVEQFNGPAGPAPGDWMGGHPGLVTEAALDLVAAGPQRAQAGALASIEPARAVAVLRTARLAACSQAAQSLAIAAAVAGRRSSVALLQRVAGLEQEPFLGALGELCDGALLLTEQDGYTLRAPEALDELSVDLAEEGAMHERALGYWRLASQMGASVPSALLARHALHAHDQAAGAFYAMQAAKEALSLFALNEAAQLLMQAGDCLSAVPDAPEGWKLNHIVLQGDYARYKGLAAEAELHYRQALAMAEKLAPERVSELGTSLGIALGMMSRLSEAEAAFRSALARCGADVSAAGRALTSLARLLLRRGCSEEAERHCEAALCLTGLPTRYRAEALGLLGLRHAASQSPRAIEGIAYLAEAQELAEENGDRLALNNACMLAGNAWMALGHFPEARSSFARNALLSQELGLSDESVCALLNLAQVAFEEGRFEESRERAKLGMEAAKEAGNPIYEAHGHLYLGLSACQLGYLGESASSLAAGLGIAHELRNDPLILQALLANMEANLFLGRLGRAEEMGLEFARRQAGSGIGEFSAQHALLMGRLYELSDEVETAVRHLREAQAIAQDGGNIALQGGAWLALAMTAKRAGQWALARERAEEALPLAERSGARLLHVRAHLLLSRLSLRLDEVEDAGRHLARAEALFGEGGSPHWQAMLWHTKALFEQDAQDLPLRAATFLRFYLNQLPPRARQEFLNWPERRELLAALNKAASLRQGGRP